MTGTKKVLLCVVVPGATAAPRRAGRLVLLALGASVLLTTSARAQAGSPARAAVAPAPCGQGHFNPQRGDPLPANAPWVVYVEPTYAGQWQATNVQSSSPSSAQSGFVVASCGDA